MSATTTPVETLRVVRDDPFRDDLFAPLDTRTGPDHIANELAKIAAENPEFAPGLQDDEVEDEGGEVVEEPVVQPAADEPEVLQYPDGSSITIEKTKKGWAATLTTGDAGANPEIFYGKTKEEMYQNVMVGKINATRKIRELNKKEKLGIAPAAPAAPVARPTVEPGVRALTADEKFAIKTQLAADPDLALQEWFQKKIGLSLEQLAGLAQEGRQAREELEAEAVSKAFIADHPDYYSVNDNYVSMLAWLAKNKLGKTVTTSTYDAQGRVVAQGNEDALNAELYHKGFWTVEFLNEAYDELTKAGLLELEPEEEEPAVPAVSPQPAAPAKPTPAATTPTSTRIASTRRRPRASLGIRPSTSTSVQTNNEELSSAEEIDDMSDEQINQLFADVRRARAKSSRR